MRPAPWLPWLVLGCTSYPAEDSGASGQAGNSAASSAGASAMGGSSAPAGTAGSAGAVSNPSTPGMLPSPGSATLGFEVPADSEPDTPLPACLHEVAVNDDEALVAALLAAKAGDCIVLGDGDYAAFELVATSGTAQAPIVVRAENPLQARIVEGQIEIQSTAYVVFEGLTIATDSTLKLIDSQYTRFTRCKFELTVEDDWLLIFGNASHHNRIDHSDLGPKPTPGPFIVLGQEDTMSQDDRIDHNYFHDNGPPAVNEKESVRIGWSEVSDRDGRAIVELNLFENCDGDPEIVSVKTNRNIVRYNTVQSSTGVLSLRHGDSSFLYGNYIFGGGKSLPCLDRDGLAVSCDTGGIRLYGKNHVIFNNYIEGTTGTGHRAPIAIDGGDGSAKSDHHQVVGAQIFANTLVDNASGLEIGANYEQPPLNSIVAYNLVSGANGRLLQVFKPQASVKLVGNVFWAGADGTPGVTGLTDAQARLVDPMLEQLDGIWKISSESPAVDAAAELGNLLADDIEGQPRDTPDVGADELSAELPHRRPLGRADVGPLSP